MTKNKAELNMQKTLDSSKESSRAYFKFTQSIKTKKTLSAYNYALDKFMANSKMTDYNKVVKLKPERIQDLLEDFVISLKKYSFSTANQYLAGVELFFDMNMVLYHKKVLRKLLPGNDKEQSGKLPYTTDEIKRMLESTTKLRSMAVIHFFASTGSRPASLEDPILRMKHIEDMPHGCKSVYIYDGSKQGYHAFLTPEASKSLDDYLRSRKLNGETLTEESPVFSNYEFHGDKTHLSANSARQIISWLLKKAGVERTKKENIQVRYDKASMYGFRKRFNTILKLNNEVNSNIAEKLMAHKRGLDGTYLQPTKDECFAEFVKAIPDLTIDQTEKQKHKIETLEMETTELKQKESQIEALEKQMKDAIKQIEILQQINTIQNKHIESQINPNKVLKDGKIYDEFYSADELENMKKKLA